MKKRLVLVGGGHAHLSVLRALANKPQASVDVTLITPHEQQNYSGMLPGWIAGHYALAQCRVELRPLVQAAGARLILEQVVGMDAARRCVRLADGLQLEYDLLSLDIGSETDTSWLQTLGDKLLPVKPLDNFFAIWPRILAQAKEKSDYRLVVVGAGAAGVEIALAAQHAFARSAPQASVDLVASEAGLLAGYGQQIQDRVRRIAQRAGLGLHFLRGVGSGDGVLLSDGRLLPADHVIATTGARAPVWLSLSKLGLDPGGYVLVDSQHRSLSHPNVFAAGDVCARPDTTLARSGVHAVLAGPVLAANLIAALNGKSLRPYRPKRYSLYLLSCGPRYAVASWGPWSAQGQWVWRWKDWIDRRFIRKFSGPNGQGKAHLQERTG